MNEMINFYICGRIASCNHMTAIAVSGNGNCQYNAILVGLRANNYPEMLNVKQLRKRTYDEIMVNADQYEEFLCQAQGSIQEYARSIPKDKCGDEVTLQVLASTLNIQIIVYQFSYVIKVFTASGTMSENTAFF